MNQYSTERTAIGLTKTRQTLLYILPFSMLLFFTVWASLERELDSFLSVAGAILIYLVLFLALASRWDKPGPMDLAISAYFLMVFALLALWPRAAAEVLAEYAVAGAYLCLFCGAVVPPILGLEPFTCHYAKKYCPREIWNTPIFMNINRTITFAWGGIFAVCIILSLYPSIVTRVIVPLVLIVGVGVPFSLRFPDYYLKRLGLPTVAEMCKTVPPPAKRAGTAVEEASASREDIAATEPGGLAPTLETSAYDQVQPKKSGRMKVIAINSSARGDGIGKTGMMLEALVKGMREAGADVETVNLRQKVIRNCTGCFTCWSKTPGVCVHEDDMSKELFPKWLEADLVIYATPLYHYNMNSVMKVFIERTLPILEPFLQRNGGKTTHPLRQEIPEAAILSVAGLPELSVFGQLSSYAKFLFGPKLIAEIYRPASEAMALPELSETVKDILEATAQSGRELIQSGKISTATMERVTQPLGSPDSFIKMANLFWASCIHEGVTPVEYKKKKLIPRPDSIETFMMIMLSGFDPQYAEKIKGTIQFAFSGKIEGVCHFRIENGKITAKEGAIENPDLMIETPFDLWMDIVTEKADGQELFFQDKFKTDGDLSLLIRMKDLFGRRQQ